GSGVAVEHGADGTTCWYSGVQADGFRLAQEHGAGNRWVAGEDVPARIRGEQHRSGEGRPCAEGHENRHQHRERGDVSRQAPWHPEEDAYAVLSTGQARKARLRTVSPFSRRLPPSRNSRPF